MDTDIEKFYNSLPGDRCYSFHVRSQAHNRLVCHPLDQPKMFFSAEFDTKTFKMLPTNSTNIDRPQQLKFNNIDALIDYVQKIDPYICQGIMVYNYDEGQVIKITNARYQELVNIRNNCPSIKFRYLQVRKDPDLAKKLIDLYPEYDTVFQKHEQIIVDIVENMYQKYLYRFVYRNNDGSRHHVVAPPEQWYHIKKLHDLYFQDPETYKISRNLISNYIDKLPANQVNYLIRKHLERECAFNDNQQD
jgi:hypothetical protein